MKSSMLKDGNRILLHRCCFLLSLIVLGSRLSSAALAEGPLNVLFICVDDLRPQLGCYGDQVVKSPNIDRLAEQGLTFDRAYCQQALCSPSRIAVLSGLRPTTTGIYKIGPTLRSKALDVVTLPQHFKRNGYRSLSFGKVFHNGIDDPTSWSEPSWHSKKARYGPKSWKLVQAAKAKWAAEGKPEPMKGSFYAGNVFGAPDVDDDYLIDGDTAREAVRTMEQLGKSGAPFFLAVGFMNPHVPWVAPKKYWDLYDPAQIEVPKDRISPKNAPDFAARTGKDFYRYGGVPKQVTPEFGRKCLHAYLAAISYIDAQVGRLLTGLEENGLTDSTVIVLWGDHGYYMGEYGWWGTKHNNYELATRSPLIVSVPEQANQGAHTSALVELMDIYPTLADVCELSIPSHVEATSLAPLLENPQLKLKNAAFSEYPKGGRHGTAMRTDRYRYVEWKNKRGHIVAKELYDHRNDSAETENIAESAGPNLLDQLHAQLAAGWRGAPEGGVSR